MITCTMLLASALLLAEPEAEPEAQPKPPSISVELYPAEFRFEFAIASARTFAPRFFSFDPSERTVFAHDPSITPGPLASFGGKRPDDRVKFIGDIASVKLLNKDGTKTIREIEFKTPGHVVEVSEWRKVRILKDEKEVEAFDLAGQMALYPRKVE